MSYKGRLITFFIVLIINSLYITYYYLRDGYISLLEIFGLPIMLTIAWIFGKQYDHAKFLHIELKKADEALKKERALYIQLIDFFPEPIIIHSDGIIMYVNENALKILGANKKEDLLGKKIIDIVHPDDRHIGIAAIQLAMKKPYEHVDIPNTNSPNSKYIEQRLIRLDGKIITMEVTGIAINFEGKKSIIAIGKDISKRKQAEEKIKNMAYHDPLTGLPNRLMINHVIKQTVSRLKRNNETGAIMFVDLDRFKEINDTFGHDAGDFVLKQVAIKLKNSIRKVDKVGRLSGDEFIIVLENINENSVLLIAERILHEFSNPIQLNTDNVIVTPSIGIALYPKDGEDLVKNADNAMYYAKKQGKNRYSFFTSQSVI